MSIKKIISILLVLLMIAAFFTGCGSKTTVKYGYNGNIEISTVSSQVVAENENLILRWNDDAKCVLIENKKTGKVWSNIPGDMLASGENCSTLDISVQDMEIYQSESFSSDKALESGKISCEKIDNGIKIVYYFDNVEISIPVTYTLREDSVLMAINGSEIQEKGDKYRLVNVSPSPQLCSVTHDKKDSYIFVPDGNGALMYTDTNADGQRKVNIGPANETSQYFESVTNPSESCGMRTFGVKDGNDAILGIAEETSGAVGFYALAGDNKTDYASINPIYYFVDYDYFLGKATNSGAVRHLSDRCQSTISVGYYFLENEDANYNGMAKCYREYLIDNGFIAENRELTKSPYSITILGGALTTSSILGIPVKTVKKMTSFSDAQKIIEDITKLTGEKPVVRMGGYTESGINIGEVAGGFDFSSKLGSEKDRRALESYCKENDIPLYFEFEMVKYSKSGSGFSYSRDSAKTAVLYPAEKSGVGIPLRDTDSTNTYRFLKRSKLEKSVNKLEKMIKSKEISGVSLATLGKTFYSDYSEGIDYAVTANIEKDTKKYYESIKKTGSRVASASASYFAAGLVDTVFDAPLDRNGKYSYDVEIPFYQLVLSGVTPLYSSAVNTMDIPQQKIMKAASTGTGLGFTLINDFEKKYMESTTQNLFACVYESNKEFIKTSLDKYTEIYKAIDNSKIDNYEILENKITKTTFENGVVVYANTSSDEVDSPIGKLAGFDFGMERE